METSIMSLLSALVVAACVANEPPKDWAHDVETGNMLFSPSAPKRGSPEANLLPNLGNGHVGHVVHSADMYVSGLYKFTQSALLVKSSERARLPAPPVITPKTGKYVGMALNISSGVVQERYLIDGTSTLELRHYVHRTRPEILVTELALNGSSNVSLDIFHAPASQDVDLQGNLTFVLGSVIKPETGAPQAWVAIQRSQPPDIISGPSNVVLITSVATASTRDAAAKSAVRAFNAARKQMFDLSSEHISAWADLWTSGFEIEGNSTLNGLAQSSMYYLLSSANAGSHWPISPGGLATNGYWGNAFWDQELWILPALLPFHPDIARAGAEYRLERFPQASAYARQTGFAGARFPWQSAVTGNKTDLAPMNALEIHISADVAVFFESIFDLTQDLAWLRRAFPLLAGIADFYVSRSLKNGANYTFKGVVPPDEFAIGKLSIRSLYTGVDDSVYTNYVARRALRFAERAAKILGFASSKTWAIVADGLIIPTAACGNACQDPKALIHLEYSGFPQGNWFLYGRGKVKQVDVALLYYPLLMDSRALSTDLAYYAHKYFPDGPAMTYAVTSILHLVIDDTNSSVNSLFTVEKHSHAPFYVWTEDKHAIQKATLFDEGCYNFLTGTGGYLQALTNGFGGLRITKDGLRVKGTLPPGTTAFALRGLKFGNASFDVRWRAASDKEELQGNACVRNGSLQASTGERISAGSCFTFTGEVTFQVARPDPMIV